MSDSNGGSPIQVALVVLIMVGGGWYFLRNYEIDGLDGVSVSPKGEFASDESFISYRDEPVILSANRSSPVDILVDNTDENPFAQTRTSEIRSDPNTGQHTARSFAPVKVASWALDGFGPTKLANPIARQNVTRVIRRFDVVALQQISSMERDLVPRLVEAINHGDTRYDFVVGQPTGPADRPEQLAFVFDTTRLVVDRRQTYTVEDPSNELMFDPLVAWFRAAQPPAAEAWTFSLVNARIDLARAPSEVALLPKVLAAIRSDGRGEDDVVLAGLLQADDAYLIPTFGGDSVRAAVRSRPTDIFGRYQTSNLLIEASTTSEYIGRSGVFDYLRPFNLNLSEAEAATSHLPVFADFTATEGGTLP